MKNMNLHVVLLIAAIGFYTNTIIAGASHSDREKEARWADQVTDSLMDGEVHWLDMDNTKHKVFSLLTKAASNSTASAPADKQAVILMHGLGIHPNWPQVIYPLRVGLPEQGWTTLAVQMPVLPNEASIKEYAPLYDEVAPRLDAAKNLLISKGYQEIIFIGHSLGASMGAYYLSLPEQQNSASHVTGFVGIGMSATGFDARMNDGKSLEKIHLPVLDLYGSDDLESVLNTRDIRKASAHKAGNQNYRQVMVKGADHFFDSKNNELLKEVISFLNAYK